MCIPSSTVLTKDQGAVSRKEHYFRKVMSLRVLFSVNDVTVLVSNLTGAIQVSRGLEQSGKLAETCFLQIFFVCVCVCVCVWRTATPI